MNLENRNAARRNFCLRLAEEQNHKCAYCGVQTNDIPNHPQCRSIERVLPAVFGGIYCYENCVMTCKRCNDEGGTNISHIIEGVFRSYGVSSGILERTAQQAYIQRALRERKLNISPFIFEGINDSLESESFRYLQKAA